MTRRDLLAASPSLAMAAKKPQFEVCMHQTTSASSGFRQSLEGYAKAGIRLVEVIPPKVAEYAKAEGMAGAKRVLSDLGLKAVSSGGVRGLAEPGAARQKALEELKTTSELIAALGVDRIVCPCGTTATYTSDDYKRSAENLREAGDIAKQFGLTVMLEFMRGSTFIGTLPTALSSVRDAAHPNVKPMLDCYHFWAGLSKFEDLDLIRTGELHHVHFQDVPNIPREMLDGRTREIPGDGVSPLARILRALAAKGYAGPLSVELFYQRFQDGDPFTVAKEIRTKSEAVLRTV
jgi:sugar phosphate isomerase/epimerase